MESIWLQITAGRGPEECGRAVYNLVNRIKKDAESHSITIKLIEVTNGKNPKTFKSVLLSVNGIKIKGFIGGWVGTVQWISKSPFRPKHKRKNWFVTVAEFRPPKVSSINLKDFEIDTMRSSGPGGQSVNRINSAIRVRHLPTGLTAIAQDERSQHLNRNLAMARIFHLIDEKQKSESMEKQQNRWQNHNEIERGNPSKIFHGEKFLEK